MMQTPPAWYHVQNLSLDAAGLIALAELTMIARRTVLKGTAYYADAFILCPGIHRQQDATSLNLGEYPITANITSGCVFRVENQATVHYLQSVGRTGCLTTLTVEAEKAPLNWLRPFIDLSGSCVAIMLYLFSALLTIVSLSMLILIRDYWALSILLALMFARLLNVIVVRRRCDATWHGAKEPGATGDLVILMSQDRWIRLKGFTDDLKRVTSGQWLRETTFFESSLQGCVIVIVYLSAAFAANASNTGKIIFVALLLVNAGLLTLSNEFLGSQHMKDYSLRVVDGPVKYHRRSDLGRQLVMESGRKDWEIKIGMINDEFEKSQSLNGKKANNIHEQQCCSVQV